jgi:ABC-type transport system substrate-binding protein/class 3 adenylate cyclase/tetratricopeptide (TPR) repeat protein
MATSGERRIVSVLITDVVDSTSIAEKLGPERSKMLFDEIAGLAGTAVLRFGGTVAQHTGDGVLALFGAPVAHEDDAERALRAALSFHAALADFARDVGSAYGIELSARAAVNTGPVVVPRGPQAADVLFNALGDTVNVAARLQSHAEPAGVVVGSLTAGQIGSRFELEALGELELKGREATVAAFRVLGERDAESRAPSSLTGRDPELAAVVDALEQLADGRGAIVSIVGEPGIGKSRLIADALLVLGDRVRVLEGHGVSYAESFPYWPVRELLRGWLELGASAPEGLVRLELRTKLARTLGDRADSAYPFLATVLGLQLERETATRMRDLAGDSVQRQTFEAVHELVRTLAGERPLCLVWDDLHWADETTLELLDELLDATEEEAVAFVLLHRSEREHPSWRLGERARQRHPHLYREFELRPLDTSASLVLAGEAAGAELPPAIAALLVERAGGNPYFLEQALLDLVERGALRRRNGSYELAVDAGALVVPAAVQEALQARLDRLDPATRHVVSCAAVAGRSFGAPLLERLLPGERVGAHLAELQRLELVVEERRRPVAEYRFRHGLAQEVAYTSLVEAERRSLHRRVGEALEELHADAPDQVYGLLGYHFAEAGEAERAVEYLLRAGDAARALYANEEAIEHYRHALRFLDELSDEPRAVDTLLKIGLSHHLAFDFSRAARAYAEAFSRPVLPEVRLHPTEQVETAEPRGESLLPGMTHSEPGWFICEHLFRGLLRADRELNVRPELAESFTVSDDGLEYVFQLREDARWQDGEPVTAHDFAYTWAQMRGEGVDTAFLLDDISSATAVGPKTLVVRMHSPRGFFLYVLATPPTFAWPAHLHERFGPRWYERELVGSGPFSLESESDGELLLVASPTWAGARGNVARLRVENASRVAHSALWGAGHLDGVTSHGEVDSTSMSGVAALGTQFVAFRCDKPPFDDLRLRYAFAAAIDRDRLVAASNRGDEPARHGGILPPPMPGHGHDSGRPYDPERARALLAEAGYPGGRGLPELRCLLPDSMSEQFAHELAAMAAEVGISVVTSRHPLRTLEAAIREEGVMFAWAWGADFPDPAGMIDAILPHWGGYFREDDELDDLLTRARAATDRDARLLLYREVDRRLTWVHASLVPVAYFHRWMCTRPWVDGMWASQMGFSTWDAAVVHRSSSTDPPPG